MLVVTQAPGTRKFHLELPKLQMSWSDFTESEWVGTSLVAQSWPPGWHVVFQFRNNHCYDLNQVTLDGLLLHWGRGKMANIFQTTFSNAFSWMKIFEFRIKFDWNFFLKIQLTKSQHWFRYWLGAEQASSHYLNQWWPRLVMHIYVTGPQWVVYLLIKPWCVEVIDQFHRCRCS